MNFSNLDEAFKNPINSSGAFFVPNDHPCIENDFSPETQQSYKISNEIQHRNAQINNYFEQEQQVPVQQEQIQQEQMNGEPVPYREYFTPYGNGCSCRRNDNFYMFIIVLLFAYIFWSQYKK